MAHGVETRESDESGTGRDESGKSRDESAKVWNESAARACRQRSFQPRHVPLIQAAQNVVPVAVTAGDKIEGLRQWASARCLSADRAGVYSRSDAGGSGGRVRRVARAE